MRMVPHSEFYDGYKLPPSRVRWAALRAKEAAEDTNAPAEIIAALEELTQMTLDHVVAHRARQAARNTTADPEMAASDNALDRSFSNFVSRVEMEYEDHGPDSERGKAAKRMLDGPLNVEVFSVTNASREEQEAMTDSILTELAADFMDDIRTCSLEAAFGVVQDNFAEFTNQMSAQASGASAPTTQQLRRMEEQIESKMIEVINRTKGTYPTTGEADRKMRSAILGPFAIQNDRAAAFYKRNRGSGALPDVDPETGEDVVDEPANDDTNDPEPAGE